MKKAKLLWGATDIGPPHFSGDILWRARFRAPDPFWLVEIDTEAYILLSPLEVERAEKESTGVRAVHFWEYLERATPKSEIEGVKLFLKDHGVQAVTIPFDFPHGFAVALADVFDITIEKGIFFPERARKSAWEIQEIEKAQRAVEQAVGKAVQFLREAKVEGDKIFSGDQAVTSELLRNIIDQDLYNQGYLGIDTIVACGIQAADPHCKGSGPLASYQPIVMDVFPLSLETHYYADQTRTVFKGEPSKELQSMYDAVLRAQEESMAMVRAGVHGDEVYKKAFDILSERYPTNISRRPMEGFIHGLGHGVGIDIHEVPRIGKSPETLAAGNIVTIEPGLYYPAAKTEIPAGGIRIEDMVLVKEDGCRNLTKFPKDLASMIL